MTELRRRSGLVVAGLFGALVGAVVMLMLSSDAAIQPEVENRPPPAPARIEPGSGPDLRRSSHVLLAWAPGGLPAGAEARVE